MKGILPAPLVMCRTPFAAPDVRGQGAGAAARGLVNAATSAEEPMSTAELDRKPAAMKSRRVTGRGWLPSWRMGS